MATFSKIPLSGGALGVPVKVAAIASTGTTIHATGTSATTVDEVWLYATSTAPVTLTIQWGGTTAPDNSITITIPATSGLTLVIPGLILTGTGAAASTVYAFASVTNICTIAGYVNRITA